MENNFNNKEYKKGSEKKTTKKTKQGKPKESKSDGDENNCFGTGEDVMMDPKEENSEGNKKKVDIVVSYPFHNKEKDTYLYVVIFLKANKTFYAKSEHFRQVIEIFYERQMIGNVNKPLKWLSTIDGINIWKKEHGLGCMLLFHGSFSFAQKGR